MHRARPEVPTTENQLNIQFSNWLSYKLVIRVARRFVRTDQIGDRGATKAWQICKKIGLK